MSDYFRLETLDQEVGKRARERNRDRERKVDVQRTNNDGVEATWGPHSQVNITAR